MEHSGIFSFLCKCQIYYKRYFLRRRALSAKCLRKMKCQSDCWFFQKMVFWFMLVKEHETVPIMINSMLSGSRLCFKLLRIPKCVPPLYHMIYHSISRTTGSCIFYEVHCQLHNIAPSLPNSLWTLIARFRGPTWGPSGIDRTQVGPMLAPWTLRSGEIY